MFPSERNIHCMNTTTPGRKLVRADTFLLTGFRRKRASRMDVIKETIERIRRAQDCVAVVESRRGSLTVRGHNYADPCPFREDRDPALTEPKSRLRALRHGREASVPSPQAGRRRRAGAEPGARGAV